MKNLENNNKNIIKKFVQIQAKYWLKSTRIIILILTKIEKYIITKTTLDLFLWH